jgi:hypothetical protein
MVWSDEAGGGLACVHAGLSGGWSPFATRLRVGVGGYPLTGGGGGLTSGFFNR